MLLANDLNILEVVVSEQVGFTFALYIWINIGGVTL